MTLAQGRALLPPDTRPGQHVRRCTQHRGTAHQPLLADRHKTGEEGAPSRPEFGFWASIKDASTWLCSFNKALVYARALGSDVAPWLPDPCTRAHLQTDLRQLE